MLNTRFFSGLTMAALLSMGASAWAADTLAQIRKHLPQLPADAEVTPTPVKGIMELRVGNDVMYVDESGQYLIQGDVIDLKGRVNLTEARTAELQKVPFEELPVEERHNSVTGKHRFMLSATTTMIATIPISRPMTCLS